MGINIHNEFLKISGTDVNATALTSGTAYYTDAVKVRASRGFSALQAVLSDGSDDLDISFQVSLNGVDWYDPVNTAGTALGTIYTALGVGSHWVVFSPQLALYIRFLLDPDANTTAAIRYIQQEGD